MLAQILQTASVVIAAASFVYGIGSWRRAAIGQKRVDLAVEGIIAFRQVEQAFREIRSPFSHDHEGATRKPRNGETESDAKLNQQAYVAMERMNARSEKFAKLQSLRHQFEAYYGKDALEPFDSVLSIQNEIVRASYLLEIHWKKQGKQFESQEAFDAHLTKMHAAEAIFWDRYEEPDPINPRVDEVMRKVDEICRDVIEPSRNIAVVAKNVRKRFRRFWLCK
ncbi:hypothetical protein IB237_23580 [Agrobacterium sp. AGB01]|uniref:hypothetical protein n=1 Tax=Agrobacterium sp. AGB01 TaxID=2769302 RepID=UPI00177D0F3A|nr:hypothetical protein [Agrobacterium sp. AGB01]MBD9390187.1 hypothetical protein [Agrobacterium sp. AGB01]